MMINFIPTMIDLDGDIMIIIITIIIIHLFGIHHFGFILIIIMILIQRKLKRFIIYLKKL